MGKARRRKKSQVVINPWTSLSPRERRLVGGQKRGGDVRPCQTGKLSKGSISVEVDELVQSQDRRVGYGKVEKI